MSDPAAGGAETTRNLARPVARTGGTVAYVADLTILLTFVAQLLLGDISGARGLLIGVLAIAVFVLAAGLAFYGDGRNSPLLVAFAGAYSLISAAILLLTAIEPDVANSGGLQLVAVMLVAVSVAAMAMVTAWIAGLPLRRLAIPFIVVALILTVAATLLVVFDSRISIDDDRSMTLGRLVLSLIGSVALVAAFLSIGGVSVASSLGQPRRS